MTRAQIAAELNPLLTKHSEALRRLALAGAERLSQMLAPADLLIYDTYAVALGWSFTGSPTDLVIHLPVYEKHINLGFNFGSTLEDPEDRLKGKGTTTRHLHFSSLTLLDDPYVIKLIEASMEQAKRGDSEGRIISKVSAKKTYATH